LFHFKPIQSRYKQILKGLNKEILIRFVSKNVLEAFPLKRNFISLYIAQNNLGNLFQLKPIQSSFKQIQKN